MIMSMMTLLMIMMVLRHCGTMIIMVMMILLILPLMKLRLLSELHIYGYVACASSMIKYMMPLLVPLLLVTKLMLMLCH